MFVNDKYEVLEILGKGGNGIVYKVKERRGERILALKETLCKDRESVANMAKEAEVLKKCFHPSLPLIIESFTQDDRYYIVMEYVEGVTLKDYVTSRGKLPVETALKIAIDVCDVLNYLHTRNQPVYYGDLKPQNIMVTEEVQVRLIDFGSAIADGQVNKGCFASTAYASPEQLKGQQGDNRSDIYGLGAIIHYMLTGEDPELPPYKRRDLRECDISLPKGLCKVINRSLKEVPAQRYQTIKSMEQDLQKFTGKEKRQKFIRQLMQGICVFFFLGFAGFGYEAMEYWQLGVRWECNSALIVALSFLIMFAVWRGCILIGIGKKNSYCIEKNIWKTDKHGIGLFLLLLVLGIWGMEIGVQAKEQKDTLPVVVYDTGGHKVLWQDNVVNTLSGAFRAELPKECFEQGKEYNITIALENRRTKEIMVRQFEVKSLK